MCPPAARPHALQMPLMTACPAVGQPQPSVLELKMGALQSSVCSKWLICMWGYTCNLEPRRLTYISPCFTYTKVMRHLPEAGRAQRRTKPSCSMSEGVGVLPAPHSTLAPTRPQTSALHMETDNGERCWPGNSRWRDVCW